LLTLLDDQERKNTIMNAYTKHYEDHARDLISSQLGFDLDQAQSIVSEALKSADDGELFIEYSISESISRDDGRLKNASSNTHHGFGLRAVHDEFIGYAHAGELSLDALRRAAGTIDNVMRGRSGQYSEAPKASAQRLYIPDNPIEAVAFEEKLSFLEKIEHYIKAKEPLVKQVSCSMSAEWQLVSILRAGDFHKADIRPLVRLNISVTVEKNGRMESGFDGAGGRYGYAHLMQEATWKSMADEALRQALVNVEADPAPAGQMDVVLGAGWPGVMLHEAVGHGLEGDFNRKKSSVFSGLMGEQIASKGVTVIDDGTMEGRRGSINIDDEGSVSQRNVLIEDGKLVGLMQDRQNARLMGVNPTGNGRRESYAYKPMPRMTNTFMMGGSHDPQEIISSVKKGLYAVNFGGGQVDITSGQFVFAASEAYLIENGKVTRPVNGATLIGKGADSLKKIKMIGNDMALDNGVGICGKDGQSVPVGVGQPTLLMEQVTVGGTQL
jgi:TldD protein